MPGGGVQVVLVVLVAVAAAAALVLLLVWCGVVWCGVVWCVVWCGVGWGGLGWGGGGWGEGEGHRSPIEHASARVGLAPLHAVHHRLAAERAVRAVCGDRHRRRRR